MDVETETAVEVEKEDSPEIVAFVDDDGILGLQGSEVGKCGAKHWVGADVVHACAFVELFETCLYARYVAYDTVLVEVGYDLTEHVERVLEGDTVDDEVGAEGFDFVEGGEALGVVEKAHSLGVNLVDCAFVVKR